jgi:hypothetical protein
VIEIFRGNGDKSHPSGDSFEFKERIDFRNPKHLQKYALYDDKNKPLDFTPVDYLTELAPDTEKAAKEWLRSYGFEGGQSSAAADNEETVPY